MVILLNGYIVKWLYCYIVILILVCLFIEEIIFSAKAENIFNNLTIEQ